MTPENVHYLIEMLGAVLMAYLAYKARETGQKMDIVHDMSNSRLTALQNEVGELKLQIGQLKGTATGIVQERARADLNIGPTDRPVTAAGGPIR